MTHYCQQAEKNKSNRQIIKNLLEDLNCVLDKSFEETDRVEADCGSLFDAVEQSKNEIDCYIKLKADLEQKIQCLEEQIEQLKGCLEEQCRAREELENLVNQLKDQLVSQDEIINCLLAEKAHLVELGKRMEGELDNYRNQCVGLESDRNNLSQGIRGFEMSRNRCGELQQALAECCEKCDSLQKENYELRQQVRDLEGNLDTAAYEKNKLIGELESMKQKFAENKDDLEAQLCQLMEEKEAYEQKRVEICRKMIEATAAHHEEMEKLKMEAENFQNACEEERRLREGLEHRLRECVESTGGAGGGGGLRATPSSSRHHMGNSNTHMGGGSAHNMGNDNSDHTGNSDPTSNGNSEGTGKRGSDGFYANLTLKSDPCIEIRRQLSIANAKVQHLQAKYEKEASERRDLDKRLKTCEKERQTAEQRAAVAEKKSYKNE